MTFISNPGSGSGSPVFDYTSRDYAAILTDLENRIPVYLPEWTSRSPNDFGIVMLQMYAYVGDLLGYYLDRLAGEAFLQTATQPQSIINLAAMLNYAPSLSAGSAVTLSITIAPSMVSSSYPVVIPVGTIFSTVPSSANPAITFVTTEALSIPGTSAATPSYVGTVTAEQGTSYSQSVATSDGTINQTYALAYNPVSAGSLTVEVDLGSGPQEWQYVTSLIDSGPTALVYTNFVDANGIFYIVFGDGVNGYVPTLGSPITASYMTNVGALGNVGPNTITVYVAPPTGDAPIVGIVSVTNPSAASGGAYAESIASIQQNAPASLSALNRGVTTNDIEALAQSYSGVLWASAVEATYQLLNLYVAPQGGGAVSTVLTETLETELDQIVMANTTVTVLSPNYIAVDISANVVVFDNYANSTVQEAVITALTNLFNLYATGFGFRIPLGIVYETILNVPGVNYAFVTQLNREELVTLLTPLVSGTSYSTLSVTELPQAVAGGDQLILSNGTSTQTVTAISGSAGGNTISVGSFTANANYPAATTTIRDTTTLADAVMLPSEIPVAGVITVTATGGIPT